MPPPFPKRLALINWQIDQLRALMSAILPDNPFYSRKFEESEAPRKITTAYQFSQEIPFTTKQELGIIHTDKKESKTELHFELWKGKTLLNPSLWLAK